MGLPMANLHAPSVPSSAALDDQNNQQTRKLSLKELTTRKDNIEAELSALSSVLDSVRLAMLLSGYS